ncbi:MAG: hypothetical protein GY856_49695, partial [bacterium]|nr:hypothetical protein [bacterium]
MGGHGGPPLRPGGADRRPGGAIETAELAWYLERYCHWPSGVFRKRARQVEAALPRWGVELYRALAAADGALADWQRADADAGPQLTIRVDRERLAAAVDEAADRADADEAATQLLGAGARRRGLPLRRRTLQSRKSKIPVRTDILWQQSVGHTTARAEGTPDGDELAVQVPAVPA